MKVDMAICKLIVNIQWTTLSAIPMLSCMMGSDDSTGKIRSKTIPVRSNPVKHLSSEEI